MSKDAQIFHLEPNDYHNFEANASTLDELWEKIRPVIGETKRDIANDGDIWDVRDEGDIHITYNNEISRWVANILVRYSYL